MASDTGVQRDGADPQLSPSPLLEEAADNAGIGFVILHQPSGEPPRVVSVNRAATQLLGRSAEELKGVSAYEIILEEEIERLRVLEERVERLAAPPSLLETVIERPDGERVPLSVGLSMRFEEGERWIVACLEDISDLEEVHAGLLDRERRHRALLEALPDMLFHLDASGRFLGFHAGTELEPTVAPEAFLGKGISDVLPREHADRVLDALDEAFETGSITTLEYEQERDGELGHYETRIVPIDDHEAIALVRDMTERVRAEQMLTEHARRLEEHARELARSNADLERFAFIASHDLREPVRTMRTHAQWLETHAADQLDDGASEVLETLVDGAAQLDQAIRSLLQYSRLSSEEPAHETFSAGEVLDSVIAELTASFEGIDVGLTAEDLPELSGDSVRFGHVLYHLIANAFRHAVSDGHVRIHVGAERVGDVWRISVSDDGPGIDPAYHERVFELFQRLEAPRGGDGVGIGLTICERAVEQHGGQIELESEPGEGTSVRFTWPAAVRAQVETDVPEAP